MSWPLSSAFPLEGPSSHLRTDRGGNLVLADTISGQVAFGNDTLKTQGRSDGVIAKLAPDCQLQWARALQALDAEAEVLISSVATDSASNITVAGAVFGHVDLGGGAVDAGAPGQLFVLQLSAAGEYRWDRRFEPALRHPLPTLAIGADDRILLVGYALGVTDFGGGPLGMRGSVDELYECESNSARPYCGVIVQFDASGGFRKDLAFTSPTGQPRATADARGGYIITGGGWGPWQVGSLTPGALWLAKLDADLGRSWGTLLDRGAFLGTDPNPYNQELLGPGIKDWAWNRMPVVDPDGNVLTLSEKDPNPAPNTGWVTEPNGFWVNKLSATGQALWPGGKLWGGGRPGGIAVDLHGETVVAGDFAAQIELGAHTLAAQGPRDLFVLKLDSEGEARWAVRLGEADGDWIGGVAVDGDANVWVAGFGGSLEPWDGQTPEPSPPAPGARNRLFVTKFAR